MADERSRFQFRISTLSLFTVVVALVFSNIMLMIRHDAQLQKSWREHFALLTETTQNSNAQIEKQNALIEKQAAQLAAQAAEFNKRMSEVETRHRKELERLRAGEGVSTV
jgi:hypothetical protein